MCHNGTRRFEIAGHGQCGYHCVCPPTTTVEEEIQLLEDHRKFMQDQLEVIDKKIASLKTAKEP